MHSLISTCTLLSRNRIEWVPMYVLYGEHRIYMFMYYALSSAIGIWELPHVMSLISWNIAESDVDISHLKLIYTYMYLLSYVDCT